MSFLTAPFAAQPLFAETLALGWRYCGLQWRSVDFVRAFPLLPRRGARVGLQHHFDATFFLVAENFITLGRLVQGQTMGNYIRWIDLAVFNPSSSGSI